MSHFSRIGDPACLVDGNQPSKVDRSGVSGQAAIADGPILPNTWAFYEGVERVPYQCRGCIEDHQASWLYHPS